jgi:hypothetical protein
MGERVLFEVVRLQHPSALSQPFMIRGEGRRLSPASLPTRAAGRGLSDPGRSGLQMLLRHTQNDSMSSKTILIVEDDEVARERQLLSFGKQAIPSSLRRTATGRWLA